MKVETLREAFKYNPETGLLAWKISKPKVKAGSVAGTLTTNGYLRVTLLGKSYRVHRVIWAMQTGSWPEHTVDHIDRVRTNNRWVNLRCATQSQNLMNRVKPDRNTSGVKGVYWHNRAGKWAGQVKKEGKVHYVGLFEDMVEAEEAVTAKRKELHGEFTVN